MGIRVLILILTIISIPFCSKEEKRCKLINVNYNNENAFCSYLPGYDSIPLGDDITLYAAATRSFFDVEQQQKVFNSSTEMNGPLRILRLNPTEGAVEDFELRPEVGRLVKDSVRFSQGSLKFFRTVFWDASAEDSLRLKIKFKPLQRGIYLINLGQQAGQDNDCAVYRYFLNVSNANKHLYYLANANNGYVSDYENKFVFCFKVY